MKKILLFTFLGLMLVVTSCRRDEVDVIKQQSPEAVDGTFVREWYDLQCKIIKETPGFFPTQAARALGYSGITLYESVVQGWPGAPRLAGQLAELSPDMLPEARISEIEYDWGIVANAAMADIMRRLYAVNITQMNTMAIEDLERKWKTSFSAGKSEETIRLSERFGRDVSQAIFDYSRTDGGHLAYLDPFENENPYTWPNITGAWIPTGNAPNPLSPRWDKNRPFLGPNVVIECQPGNHAVYSTDPNSEFYKAAMEVYEVVSNHTNEQRVIAEFWADDPFETCTPAGHTFNIMTQLLEEHNANLAMAALGYAKLGIAESDVFIACWKSKYDYFLIRPVSYIKEHIDPNFNTLIGTPPFPAYTSGHASEAAAGSRVFTAMFTRGDGLYKFTDRTGLRHGHGVRSFRSFDEVARECANSRLYGGIHYDFDNQLGLSIGYAIGDAVNRRLSWPKSEFGQ